MAKVSNSPDVCRAILVAAFVGMALVSQAQAQSCPSQLTNLNVCAPFVVPGNTQTPSAGCCGALQAVDHDCLCNTLRIISRLPSECNVTPIACGN